MKSERVTQAWEFYRDNCPGFKEPMRKQFRRLDEYVSVVETENAKLKRAAERDADVMESLNLSLEESQAENAKLRELVRGLHIAHVGMTNRYKGSEIALICEYSGDIENDARKLESECAEECHRFDAAMRELGIEVG